jgi:hypothetical protein
MSKAYVSEQLRQTIEEAAHYRCGYCLLPQKITGLRLQIDHIVPEAVGGLTVEDNLWLACVACNRYKRDLTHFQDLETGQIVALFNPRHQKWDEHFKWSANGTMIEGLTACGRVTVAALQMNNEVIAASRSLWVQFGLWPPET